MITTLSRFLPVAIVMWDGVSSTFLQLAIGNGGLTLITSDAPDRVETYCIIYEELCCYLVTKKSHTAYVAYAQRLVDSGSGCQILGCTEVGMLLNQSKQSVPVFDTTLAHCDAALIIAFGE